MQGDLSKIYNERISNLDKKKLDDEKEIICDDTQTFLKKFYGQEQKSKPIKQNEVKENVEKGKFNMKDYGTNATPTTEDVKKQMIKNISSGKIRTADYNTNTNDTSKINIEGASKEDLITKIKNQELENLTGIKKEDPGNSAKPSANELLKKRLDALKSGKKS